MNNLVRDARKVREIILMVGDVSDIYVTGFGRMMKDENFSVRNWTPSLPVIRNFWRRATAYCRI